MLLKRGQSWTLPTLDKINLSIGWEESAESVLFDLDFGVALFDFENRHIEDVYFHRRQGQNGAVKYHSQSDINETTNDEADQGKISIHLSSLQDNVKSLFFAISVFAEGVSLSVIQKSWCRLFGGDNSNEELCRCEWDDDLVQNSLITCVLQRDERAAAWRIQALGLEGHGKTVRHLRGQLEQILESAALEKMRAKAINGVAAPIIFLGVGSGSFFGGGGMNGNHHKEDEEEKTARLNRHEDNFLSELTKEKSKENEEKPVAQKNEENNNISTPTLFREDLDAWFEFSTNGKRAPHIQRDNNSNNDYRMDPRFKASIEEQGDETFRLDHSTDVIGSPLVAFSSSKTAANFQRKEGDDKSPLDAAPWRNTRRANSNNNNSSLMNSSTFSYGENAFKNNENSSTDLSTMDNTASSRLFSSPTASTLHARMLLLAGQGRDVSIDSLVADMAKYNSNNNEEFSSRTAVFFVFSSESSVCNLPPIEVTAVFGDKVFGTFPLKTRHTEMETAAPPVPLSSIYRVVRVRGQKASSVLIKKAASASFNSQSILNGSSLMAETNGNTTTRDEPVVILEEEEEEEKNEDDKWNTTANNDEEEEEVEQDRSNTASSSQENRIQQQYHYRLDATQEEESKNEGVIPSPSPLVVVDATRLSSFSPNVDDSSPSFLDVVRMRYDKSATPSTSPPRSLHIVLPVADEEDEEKNSGDENNNSTYPPLPPPAFTSEGGLPEPTSSPDARMKLLNPNDSPDLSGITDRAVALQMLRDHIDEFGDIDDHGIDSFRELEPRVFNQTSEKKRNESGVTPFRGFSTLLSSSARENNTPVRAALFPIPVDQQDASVGQSFFPSPRLHHSIEEPQAPFSDQIPNESNGENQRPIYFSAAVSDSSSIALAPATNFIPAGGAAIAATTTPEQPSRLSPISMFPSEILNLDAKVSQSSTFPQPTPGIVFSSPIYSSGVQNISHAMTDSNNDDEKKSSSASSNHNRTSNSYSNSVSRSDQEVAEQIISQLESPSQLVHFLDEAAKYFDFAPVAGEEDRQSKRTISTSFFSTTSSTQQRGRKVSSVRHQEEEDEGEQKQNVSKISPFTVTTTKTAATSINSANSSPNFDDFAPEIKDREANISHLTIGRGKVSKKNERTREEEQEEDACSSSFSSRVTLANNNNNNNNSSALSPALYQHPLDTKKTSKNSNISPSSSSENRIKWDSKLLIPSSNLSQHANKPISISKSKRIQELEGVNNVLQAQLKDVLSENADLMRERVVLKSNLAAALARARIAEEVLENRLGEV